MLTDNDRSGGGGDLTIRVNVEPLRYVFETISILSLQRLFIHDTLIKKQKTITRNK